MANNANKRHYHMACAQVIFREKDIEDSAPQMVMVNVINYSAETRNLNADSLRKMQIGAQQQFAQKMGVEYLAKTAVVDIVFLSSSYLGFMTEKEFLGDPVQQAQTREQSVAKLKELMASNAEAVTETAGSSFEVAGDAVITQSKPVMANDPDAPEPPQAA